MSIFFSIKIEEEELEEFELLEQAAANASFSSNSSVVVKALAKARGFAQNTKQVSQRQSVTNNRGTEYNQMSNLSGPLLTGQLP